LIAIRIRVKTGSFASRPSESSKIVTPAIDQPARTTRRKIFRLPRQLHRAATCVDSGLLCSEDRRHTLAQTIGNARGIDINSPLSAEAHTQDLRFRRHQQHDDPNSARGLDNNFAFDRDCDSTTIIRLRHRRLHRADHAAPDKS
jgi:hypothetical protein